MIELHFKYSHQDFVLSDEEFKKNLPFIKRIAYSLFKFIWTLLYWSAIMLPISFLLASPKYEIRYFWPLLISACAVFLGAFVIPNYYDKKEKDSLVYDKEIVLSFFDDSMVFNINNKVETKYYYGILEEIDVSAVRFVLKFKFENQIMLIPESAFASDVQRQLLVDFLHSKLEKGPAAAPA